jgi:predicted RNA binding protein YcfA (HicA-like mRNA interferase family)
MTSRQVIRLLARAGWRRDRQEGSHIMLVRTDGTGLVVVPDHPGDLRPKTLRGILKQAEMSPAEFNRLRLGRG